MLLFDFGHNHDSHQVWQVCLRLVQLPIPIENPQTPLMSTCHGFPIGFPLQNHTTCLTTHHVCRTCSFLPFLDKIKTPREPILFRENARPFFNFSEPPIKTNPQGQGPRPFPIFDLSSLVFSHRTMHLCLSVVWQFWACTWATPGATPGATTC